MSDLKHVLYNTVGDNFEKYLTGKELLTMSEVMKHEEDSMSSNFRKLVMHVKNEYQKFVNVNNRLSRTIDEFFLNIPLRVIFKDVDYIDYINLIISHFNLTSKTILCIIIELSDLDLIKKEIENMVKNDNYLEYLSQASMRLREDVVEYCYWLLNTSIKKYVLDVSFYPYYPATEYLRELYIEDGMDEYLLSSLLYFAVCFDEPHILEEYCMEHYGRVPISYQTFMHDDSLKYNINRFILSGIDNCTMDDINNLDSDIHEQLLNYSKTNDIKDICKPTAHLSYQHIISPLTILLKLYKLPSNILDGITGFYQLFYYLLNLADINNSSIKDILMSTSIKELGIEEDLYKYLYIIMEYYNMTPEEVQHVTLQYL